MRASNLREMKDDELQQLLREKQDALFNFRIQFATGSVPNVRAARHARKDIARLNTIIHERHLKAAGKE